MLQPSLFYTCYFNILNFLTPHNSRYLVWSKFPLDRRNKQTHLSGLLAFWPCRAPMTGLTQWELTCFFMQCWENGSFLLQEEGQSWIHPVVYEPNVPRTAAFSLKAHAQEQRGSLFTSFCYTSLLSIPYKLLKKTASSPFQSAEEGMDCYESKELSF